MLQTDFLVHSGYFLLSHELSHCKILFLLYSSKDKCSNTLNFTSVKDVRLKNLAATNFEFCQNKERPIFHSFGSKCLPLTFELQFNASSSNNIIRICT